MKPQEFEEKYILKCHTSYQLGREPRKGRFAEGGVLPEGAIVWLSEMPSERALDTLVSAYAEGVGLIVLDSRLLNRAN